MIDYLDDLESDFSRFHRVDDIYAMEGPRFFRMAARIFAYDGVMAMRARIEEEEMAPQQAAPAPRASSPRRGEGGRREVPAAAVAVENPDLFSMVKVA